MTDPFILSLQLFQLLPVPEAVNFTCFSTNIYKSLEEIFLNLKEPVGNMLCPTDQVKNIGVIVSSDMSWSLHVSSMASRAGKVAALVLSAFKCRNRITMLTLYKSLVRSHLEYCCPLWNTSKISDIHKIKGVQRTFTSKI